MNSKLPKPVYLLREYVRLDLEWPDNYLLFFAQSYSNRKDSSNAHRIFIGATNQNFPDLDIDIPKYSCPLALIFTSLEGQPHLIPLALLTALNDRRIRHHLRELLT